MADIQPTDDESSPLSSITGSWEHVQVVGHAWMDRGLAREAVIHRRPSARGPQRVTDSSKLGERDQPFSLWCDGPRRIRAEYTIGAELIMVVVDQGRWWRTSAVLGATSGSLANRPPALLLGAPGVLAQGHDLVRQLDDTTVSDSSVAGRKAIRIEGTPNQRRGAGRFFFREAGIGADRYGICVDAENGFTLSVTAYRQGDAFRVIEAHSVDFDKPIGPKLFDPPDRPSKVPTRGRQHERIDVSSVELRDRFTILVPADPPSPVPPYVAVFDSDQRGPGPQRLVLTYAVNDREHGRGQLRLTESAFELGRSVHDGWVEDDNVLVSEVTYGRVPRRRVRARRHGTYVELDSTVIPLEQLRELLADLVPSED